MKGVEKSVCAQHGVLGHVFGFAATAEQPPRQVVGGVKVRHHDCLKSAAVSLIQHVRWRVRRQVSLFQAPKEITERSSILFPSGGNLLTRKKSSRPGIKPRAGGSCMVIQAE